MAGLAAQEDLGTTHHGAVVDVVGEPSLHLVGEQLETPDPDTNVPSLTATSTRALASDAAVIVGAGVT